MVLLVFCLCGPTFLGAPPTSKLSFEALSATFFDRLGIFSDATNLTITLVVFVCALPAPEARKHLQQRLEAALYFC